MLHIANTNNNTHKKTFAIEVFVGVMLFSALHVAITQASDITGDNVIKLVNKARTSANLAILEKNDLLQKAAEKKAQDMIDDDYFAHVSPDGKSPWYWIENVKYNYQYAGENLAINYVNAEDEQQAWMDSPLHRKNIMNPDYQEIGVAVKQGIINGQKTTIAVQMFGAQFPKEAVAVSVVKPTPSSSQATVAGVASTSLMQNNNIQKSFDKVFSKEFYENNKFTLIAWFAAIGFAMVIIIVDVLAVFHKKHEQFFILKDVRNKHA